MKLNVVAVSALFITSFLIASCEKKESNPRIDPVKIELTEKSSELISGSNTFGLQLFAHVASENDSNLMLSPLSAGIALSMAANGAANSSYEQIRDVLGYPANMSIEEINQTYLSLVTQLLNVDPGVSLSIANALFYSEDFSFKQSFVNEISDIYGAHVESLDFYSPYAIDLINNWASEKTNNRISRVVDMLPEDLKLMLLNAILFKGEWTFGFDKNETAYMPFTLSDGSVKNVKTMSGRQGSKLFFGQGYKAVELPYGQTNFSMVVILPDNELTEFYQHFTPELWDKITSGLNARDSWFSKDIQLPLFKFEFECNLNDALYGMGMLDPFNRYSADFSNMTNENIYIGFVRQNSFVEVNEKGTEAAAVTSVGFLPISTNRLFRVDRPFIFGIRERTSNTLLFIGSVFDPSE